MKFTVGPARVTKEFLKEVRYKPTSLPLKFGQKVRITGYIEITHYTFKEKTYRVRKRCKLREPIEGIIVRRYYKRGGVVEVGPLGEYGQQEGPNYLDIKRQYLVYDVAFSLNRKVLPVCPSQLEIL